MNNKTVKKEAQILADFLKECKNKDADVSKIIIECDACSIGGESDAGWVANFYYYDDHGRESDFFIQERDIKDILPELTQKLMPPHHDPNKEYDHACYPSVDMKFTIYKNRVHVSVTYHERLL